ncbi:MAG TPA: proline--tRNA ligase [bacterium]|nr:proline--tRNA ligase [bacterium]HQG45194.1 proline--tRNA ligase [bacterium]HQI48533.1 proline--tRNA ligase [bacterium]HQJ64050.1 proline--tRNA ligase [bacterium]
MAKGITTREADYSQWYLDVVAAAELAEHAAVKGCMVIKPTGYAIWEMIQSQLDKMFKASGHVNAYFPLFIPESFLKKEAEHVEGFAPECAVVTHGGGKRLEEPLVVRPTSETIIWSTYKNWIQSYRDLPILINQWANVVRWEMRTRLFLRTTEFLWQEGHTAHATAEEAEAETLKILDIYRRFAEEYMATPVFYGLKTDAQRFAGAVRTYCIEAMMQDRKALQAGTSHNLGQNFARAFDVTFQSEQGRLEYVYASSWGVSTRLIGGLIMTHSDDNGLVLPPRLAPVKAVLVPIWKEDAEREKMTARARELTAGWEESISFRIDDRDQYRPGYKFNEWEKKGVPVRIEMGPKDLAAHQVVLVRRDTGVKITVPQENLLPRLQNLLEEIQKNLFERARVFRDANTFTVDAYADLADQIEKPGGFFWVHWCGSPACEEKFQEEHKATIRLVPLNEKKEEGACIVCGKPSHQRVLVAKSY